VTWHNNETQEFWHPIPYYLLIIY